jgi:hypothetical protein
MTERPTLSTTAGAPVADNQNPITVARAVRFSWRRAVKGENEEFSAQVRSEAAKEALRAFLEKRPPDSTRTMRSAAAGWLSRTTR